MIALPSIVSAVVIPIFLAITWWNGGMPRLGTILWDNPSAYALFAMVFSFCVFGWFLIAFEIRYARMPKKCLSKQDCPANAWEPYMEGLVLYSNGMIVLPLDGTEVGHLDGRGGVRWTTSTHVIEHWQHRRKAVTANGQTLA